MENQRNLRNRQFSDKEPSFTFRRPSVALSFPQQLGNTPFNSVAGWALACSWRRTRKRKKLSKRKSGNDGILIFACYLLVYSLLFSFIVRNELKKKNPREGTGPSPTRSIYLPNIFNENAQTAACQPPNGRPVDSE